MVVATIIKDIILINVSFQVGFIFLFFNSEVRNKRIIRDDGRLSLIRYQCPYDPGGSRSQDDDNNKEPGITAGAKVEQEKGKRC